MLSSQLQDRGYMLFGESYSALATYLIQLIGTVTIVIILPIINHAILPFSSVSLKIRLGIGQTLNLLAVLIATLFQGTVEVNEKSHDIEKLLWLFIPVIILSIGEALTFVTG